MIGQLTFDLPNEKEEFDLASHAGEYAMALTEICNFIRNKLKHEELSDETEKVLEELRTFVYQEIEGLPYI